MANNRIASTYDIMMKDPKRKERFEEKYAPFLLSEILVGLMEQAKISVRAPAKSVGSNSSYPTRKTEEYYRKKPTRDVAALGATVSIGKG
jgi:hypothetical protein